MVFRRALPIVLLAAAALTPHPARADASLEAQVMSRIRGYRSASIAVHSGLLAAARNHSRGMSSRGGLNHDGADARVQGAAPDPMEMNGAPDDGFGVASWCENVTYVANYFPYSEVAQRIFNAWEGSGAHGRCMKEGHRNVGAVGIYYDGEFWWATYIAQVDKTPPGGAPPAPKEEPAEKPEAKKPAPIAKPEASAPPQDAPAPKADEPAGLLNRAENEVVADSESEVPLREKATAESKPEEADVAPARAPLVDAQQPALLGRVGPDPRTRETSSIGYGWQELAAVAVLLVLATPLLARLRERPSEMKRRDHIALTQIEPVRPCALSAGIERYVVAARVPSDLREMVVEPLAVAT
jgi:hypothetical protein